MWKRCLFIVVMVLWTTLLCSCGSNKKSEPKILPLGIGGEVPPTLIGEAYSTELVCTNVVKPCFWSVEAGTLPPGLSIDAEGVISGTPTQLGNWPFTIALTDSAVPPRKVTQDFTMKVVEVLLQKGDYNPPSAGIPTLSKDTVMMQIKLRSASTVFAGSLTGLTFTASGSGNEVTDVDSVRLYRDVNGNGQLDPSDTQLDNTKTYLQDNGTIHFNFNLIIGPSETQNLILVYDFNRNAWPEEQFSVSVEKDSDVTLSVTFAETPLPGNQQRIRHPSWVRRYPTTRDSSGAIVPLTGRTNHEWAYDSVRNTFVMFSGAPVGFQNETWEYYGATQEWVRVGTDLAPSDPAPCPRQNHAMCFVKAAGEPPAHVLLFGGHCTWQMPSYILDDTCRYVNGQWGGIQGYETASSGVLNPFYWTYYHPNPSPMRRECAAMEYHDAVGVVVLYGGCRSWPGVPSEYSDTWITQGNPNLPTQTGGSLIQYSPIWQQLYSNSPPGSRYYHVMTYDPTEQRILMFGGFRAMINPPVLLNDIWEMGTDLTWRELNPVHKPSPRRNHAMMYDPHMQALILFGGATDSGTRYNDTWLYARTERDSDYDWKQIQPPNKPSARDGHVMGWDPIRQLSRAEYNSLYPIPAHVGRVPAGVGVLFDGYSAYGDTWEYLR